jgi:hypothetical protein
MLAQALAALPILHVLLHPQLDQIPRKQQLSRHAAHGNRAVGGELVDLALLDAQQIRDFLGGQELWQRHGISFDGSGLTI